MQGSTSKLKEKGAELLPSTSEALRFNFQYKKKGKPWGMWSTHYFSVVLARLSRSTADLKRAWQFLIPPTSLVIGSVVTLFQPPPEEERGIALVSGLASLGEAFGGIGFPLFPRRREEPLPHLCGVSGWLSCCLLCTSQANLPGSELPGRWGPQQNSTIFPFSNKCKLLQTI